MIQLFGRLVMSTGSHSHLRRAVNLHGSFEGRSSRLYDVLARRVLRGLYRRIAADIALAAPLDGTVLDVGTGPGVLLAEIARARPDLHVTGIDLSEDMVAAAGRNTREFAGRVRVQAGDVTGLPFADGTFDLIVTSFSLHHWDDIDAAVPELARVLRPGGRLYVYDFRRAPFEILDTAAGRKGLLAGEPVQHTVIRTGQLPPLRHCVRHVLSTETITRAA
jgi:ubiquinone/menaquinone biosynthesis C-methylase UbiE